MKYMNMAFFKASRREAFTAGGLRERGNIKDIVGIMFYCFASTPAGWCFFGVPEKSSRSLAMTGCRSASECILISRVIPRLACMRGMING